jgi:hypothetical protein
MERKSKFALAAAAGVVSLFAVSAIAQQTANPPGEQPAVNAPAANGQTLDAGKAQGKDAEKPGERASEDKSAERRGRHSSRGERGMRGREGRGNRMARSNRWRTMSEEDRKAYFEARLASVKAGLLLNETQAKLWPYIETAVREMAGKRREWAEKIKKEGRPDNPFDRMKRRADMMADRAAGMQKFAIAAKPLYDTLSDDQKRRLTVLTRGIHRGGMMRPMHGHSMMMRNQRGHHGTQGRDRQHWQRHGDYHQRGYGSQENRYGQNSQPNGRRWSQSFNEGKGLDRGNGLADWQQL